MGVFVTRRVFVADPTLIPAIAKEVALQFQNEGYTVQNSELLGGNAEISITKGGIFKAVAGLKTALKVTLRQGNGQIQAEAGVGIFGQQAIPTVISVLFFWPVLVTQIWGMIQQSHLDDHAMELIDRSISASGQHYVTRTSSSATVASSANRGSFCPDCGTAAGGGKFCAGCGTKLD